MKKLVLLVVSMLGGFMSLQAQTLLDVNASKSVNLVVDFSEASICSMSESDFSNYEPNYTRLRPEVVAKLVEAFNDTQKVNFLLGTFPKAAYTIKVSVVSVSAKGNMMSNAEVVDTTGKVIATVSDIKGEGGVFGTKMNLMGDGCKSTGKVLAKKLAKMIKAEAKK